MKRKFYYSKAIIFKPIFTTFLVLVAFFRRMLIRGFKTRSLNLHDYDIKFFYIATAVVLVFTLVNMFIKFKLYRASYIEIDKQSIVYKKKTLFSEKYKETALDKISNIHLKRSFLDKLFSSVTLSLDINSSETSEDEDYSILLSKQASEEFKELFYQYRRGVNLEVDDDECVVEEQHRYDHVYKFSKGECAQHIAFSLSVFLFIFVVASSIMSIADLLAGISVTSLLLFSVMFIVDLVKKVDKYYDYSVYADNTHIKWEYGFFNREEFEVEKSKIISLEFRQTLISRLFNKYSVDINIVGVGSDNSDMKTVVLYSSKEKMLEILGMILPESCFSFDFEREDLRILCYRLSKGVLILVIPLLLPIVRHYLLYYVPIVAVILIGIFLYSKNLGFSYVGEKVTIRRGLFEVSSHEILLSSIEYIDIKTDYIYKKLGVVSLVVHYKNAKGTGELTSPYVKAEMIQKVVDCFEGHQ